MEKLNIQTEIYYVAKLMEIMENPNILEVKDEKITLKSYFTSLPSFEKRPFVNKICDLCEVSEATAYNWISGRNKPVKASYYRILSEITGIEEKSLFAN